MIESSMKRTTGITDCTDKNRNSPTGTKESLGYDQIVPFSKGDFQGFSWKRGKEGVVSHCYGQRLCFSKNTGRITSVYWIEHQKPDLFGYTSRSGVLA